MRYKDSNPEAGDAELHRGEHRLGLTILHQHIVKCDTPKESDRSDFCRSSLG